MIFLLTQVARFYKLLTLILVVVIAALSLWPVESLPAVPGTDKTHHFIGYAALIFPTAVAYFIKNIQLFNKRLFFVWCLMVLYSGLIELIQPYVNRYGEWLDLAANSIGLLCGVILAKGIVHLFFTTDSLK